MTTAQLDHLEKIITLLDNLLTIAAKRTPGRWRFESFNSPIGETGDYEGVIQVQTTECRQSDPVLCEAWNPDDDQEANFHFIAACSVNAEAGWKATRAAIEYISADAVAFAATTTRGQAARSQIESILAAFPLELVTP